MAFKFYVNNVEKKVETNAYFRATQDESLDDGSLVLEWVDSEETIKPRTPVRISEYDSNNVLIHEWNFIVLSDDVEPVTKANNLFSHRLTVVQNTHSLNHRLLRNSNFFQPNDFKTAHTEARGYLLVTATSNGSGGYNFSTNGQLHLPVSYIETATNLYRKDKVYFAPNETMQNVTIKIDTYCLRFLSINAESAASVGGNELKCYQQTGNENDWKRNRHNSFSMKLEYRSNSSSANPDYTETITINAGNSNNYTGIQTLSTNFFTTHGAGWYSLALDTNNLPTFVLSSSSPNEISFVVDDRQGIHPNVQYANILVLLNISMELNTILYTLYDVLDLIRKESVKELNGTYRATAPYSLVPRAESDLSKIAAPDFQFTGGTVFDAVSQVFNYIDAVPVILREKRIGAYIYTNVLDYEFLNEFDGDSISTDYKFADKKTRIEDKYYDNQIVTPYNNARQPTTIDYPAKNIYKQLESESLGVVGTNYKISVDKPIEKVTKLYIDGLDQQCGYEFSIPNVVPQDYAAINAVRYIDFNIPYGLDISGILVEKSEYQKLLVGSPTDDERRKSNTLMFEQGSKEILIGTYEEIGYTSINLWNAILNLFKRDWEYYKTDINFVGLMESTNLYDTYYSIEYIPLLDGQVMVESPEDKAEGQFVVAQSGSTTALNKMGSNMLGFISKSGNESKVVTMQLATYDARLKKGSIWVDANNNQWIANIVKVTFTTTDQIITEVELVKNFNMISQRTQVDHEIKYTIVDRTRTNKAYENVNEYLYFSTSALTSENDVAYTDTLLNTLLGTLTNTNTNYCIADCSVQLDTNDRCFIPCHVYGAGNVLNFECNYNDPTLAGSYIVTSGTIQSVSLLYTNDGYGDNINVQFYSRASGGNVKRSNYPLYQNNSFTNMISFDYKYYKRPSEILSFNYGIALLANPGEQIYFGEEFLTQNNLIPNNKYYETKNRKLYFYISQEEKYGVNSKKALGDRQSNLNISINTTNRTITITADWGYYANAISWCIADDDENIYIAGNQELTASNSQFTVVLYYAKRKMRI